MNFSERYGFKPVKQFIQLESMDDALRNGLWNVIQVGCWDNVRYSRIGMRSGYHLNSSSNAPIRNFCRRLWLDYFKKPIDELRNDWRQVHPELRQYFFQCKWHEAYDFIEFVAGNYGQSDFSEGFQKLCNDVMEKEMSAYRFVTGTITRITQKEEVDEIEQAFKTSRGPVATHLQRSLELLSDRKNPDYRNSIKESISAVEGLVAITTKNNKGTLGQLLKKLEDEIGLHQALKTAFSNLYGYTSDEKGIRHALSEVARVDFNDAKFMLVVCSSFINFVEGKLRSNGARGLKG